MSHQPGSDSRIIIVFPRNSVCTKCRDSGQQSGLMKTSKVRVNNSSDTEAGRGGGGGGEGERGHGVMMSPPTINISPPASR